MEALPLTQNLSSNNLFRLLNLPLSSKWPQVKKAYEVRIKDLESQLEKPAPDSDKAAVKRELDNLQQAYSAFSARISEKNAELYQTREALKALDLPEGSDWDVVRDRFETLRQHGQEQPYTSAFQQLEARKPLLMRDNRTGKTWVGAAMALGAAGISLAAYHTLNADEASELMETASPEAVTDPAGADRTAVPTLGTDALETDSLNQYIEENYSIEQELLSMIGMAPDQLISLTLQRKMEVFVSMAKSV
ncbi:hypothetical protein SAMN05421747_10527 [Parapedobacter composti]|uniref:Uncharacterized protein n=1 Tax=Parapedobacter composti TaxID=623281 RepID=A0A1I1GX19_9SPHI|nr:hypothetical protein [Parapedobacter composti]SFC13713.1 hypothetical protein SAMN05421747_10527 [Parapedobacter composti]